jgi:hypothetical protein
VTHSDLPTPEDESPAPPKRGRVRPVVIGGSLALVVVLGGLYAARNLIAREALLNWLRERGVPAQADLSGLGLAGVAGRIVVGPPNDPDFSVERSEIGYGLTGFWNNQPLGVQISSVRLIRPVVKARLVGGKLSFGALDPVIEEFRRRPPRPDVRQPVVQVEDGRLRLASDYGAADVRADAFMNDGKLLRLDARLAPTRLKMRTTTADLSGAVRLRTRDDRVDILADMTVRSLADPALQAEDARLRIAGRGTGWSASASRRPRRSWPQAQGAMRTPRSPQRSPAARPAGSTTCR